jgi:hypothetical protein
MTPVAHHLLLFFDVTKQANAMTSAPTRTWEDCVVFGDRSWDALSTEEERQLKLLMTKSAVNR